MLFRKTWVFGWTSKFNQLKCFSPLTIKSFPFIFSLQTISGPSFRRAKRERERERERNGEQEQIELQSDDHRLSSSLTTHIAPIAPVSSIAAPCRSHHTDQAKIDSNAAWSRLHRTISPLPPPRNLASRSNPVASLSSFSQFDQIWWIFFFWVLFLLGLWIEKLYYIFVWKLRKCEQQVENVFSIVFSRTQPKTRKYFPKHFLECNQTLENILHSKIFYTRKIFYTQPNIALVSNLRPCWVPNPTKDYFRDARSDLT